MHDETLTRPPDPDATLTSGAAVRTGFVPAAVPGYAIHEALGEGGMGIVFKATHIKLNRTVALKMVHGGGLGKERTRFLAEAEAIAAIDHPHVVRIFDTGEAEGRPYLAMEYLSGGSLAEKLKASPGREAGESSRGRTPPAHAGGSPVVGISPLSPRDAAELVRKLALAVQAAHDRQIVHRDLKPANILFDSAGEPRVTDFGLAKKAGGSDLTGSNAIMGTAAYMAPEQAKGESKFVGPGADVWALGVILYECLSGARPFTGANEIEVIRKVVDSEPSGLRSHSRELPRDLELIAMKCLRKDAASRYTTAGALADDLQNWLHGKPVSVKAAGPVERTTKWVKRNKLAAGIVAAAVLGMFVTSFLAVLVWEESQHSNRLAESMIQETKRANAKQMLADEKEKEARLAAENARQEKLRADAERTKAEMQLDRAERLIYANDIQVAERLWNDGNAGAAIDRLTNARWDFRGWEFNYLWRKFHHNQLILNTGAMTIGAAWSGDGRRMATYCDDKSASIWDASNGRLLRRFEHPDKVTGFALSDDGRRLATACADVKCRVWDCDTGAILHTIQTPRPMTCLAMSGDGRRLLIGCDDGFARLRDVETGASLLEVRGELGLLFGKGDQPATALALSPDGRLGAMINGTTTLKVFDLATGARRMRNEAVFGTTSVAFTADSSHVIIGGTFGRADLFHVTDSEVLQQFTGHLGPVSSTAASPDGRRIVTGSWDGTLRVWDAETGQTLTRLTGHTKHVAAVAVSPDGRRILSAGWENTARVWDLAAAPDSVDLPLQYGVALSHTTLISGASRIYQVQGNTLKVWNTATRQQEREVSLGQFFMLQAVSPDGRRLYGSTFKNAMMIVDAETGATLGALGTLDTKEDAITAIGVSMDGARLITGSSATNGVRFWDAATLKPLPEQARHDGRVSCVAFSRDGRRAVSGSWDRTLRLWDPATGQPLAVLKGHASLIHCVAFSPDGRRLVSGGHNGVVRVWDVESGTVERELLGHTKQVSSVAFSPDGRRIITGGHDNTVRVWDADAGTALLELPGPPAPQTLIRALTAAIESAAMSADGRQIVATSHSGIVRIWTAGGGPGLLELKGHTGPIISIGVSGDPMVIVTEQSDKTVRAFDPKSGRPIEGKLEFPPGKTDGRFHFHFDDSKTYVVNDAILAADEKEAAAAWTASAKPNAAWHRKQAREAERAEQWFAASFHLRRLVALTPNDEALKVRLQIAVEKLPREQAPKPRAAPSK